MPVGSSGSVAVAESDPNIIWYGTGSDGVRSNVSTGRGVYRSTDGGKTWSFAGLYNAGQIGAVRIHPTDPNTAWVAAYGDAFSKNAERGIFKTTDGGKTWRKTLYRLGLGRRHGRRTPTGEPIRRLRLDGPAGAEAVDDHQRRRREGGFYKSTDGGDTGRKIMTAAPVELIGKGNLAVTAANPQSHLRARRGQAGRRALSLG